MQDLIVIIFEGYKLRQSFVRSVLLSSYHFLGIRSNSLLNYP